MGRNKRIDYITRRFETFPDLLHALVTDAPSGLGAKGLAALLGKRHHVLLNEANPDIDTHKLGVEMVEPLMAHTGGAGLVATYIARRAGGAFVDLRDIAQPVSLATIGMVKDRCLRAMDEFGDVAGEVWARTGDGVLSKEDCKALTHEIWECIEALLVLDAAAYAAEGSHE